MQEHLSLLKTTSFSFAAGDGLRREPELDSPQRKPQPGRDRHHGAPVTSSFFFPDLFARWLKKARRGSEWLRCVCEVHRKRFGFPTNRFKNNNGLIYFSMDISPFCSWHGRCADVPCESRMAGYLTDARLPEVSRNERWRAANKNYMFFFFPQERF